LNDVLRLWRGESPVPEAGTQRPAVFVAELFQRGTCGGGVVRPRRKHDRPARLSEAAVCMLPAAGVWQCGWLIERGRNHVGKISRTGMDANSIISRLGANPRKTPPSSRSAPGHRHNLPQFAGGSGRPGLSRTAVDVHGQASARTRLRMSAQCKAGPISTHWRTNAPSLQLVVVQTHDYIKFL